MTATIIYPDWDELRAQRGLPPIKVPQPVTLLDQGWDEPDIEDVPAMDRARYWGPEYANPLTLHFSRGDPGDEI